MNWHRLFGLILTDFFTDSPFSVELEKDLAIRRQLLDVVILRRASGPFPGRLPDGLDDLGTHNLITFKSHHDALDDWALKELTGHYVNYRKQCTERGAQLLPEAEFRLYAVCSRYPHNLAKQVPLEPVKPGVYTCKRGTDVIPIVVAGQVAREPHNALLHLFSASAESVDYGADHYRQRSQEANALLRDLLGSYEGEGINMAYTMADYRRDKLIEQLKSATKEELATALQGVPVELLLAGIPPEERLAGIPPEERLKGLSRAEIARCLRKLKPKRTDRKTKPRGGRGTD